MRANSAIMVEGLYVSENEIDAEIQYTVPVRRTLPADDRYIVPDNMPFVTDSVLFLEFTRDELARRSSLIVRGVVSGVSYPFFAESALGNQQLFTEYYVEVREILRGETSASEIAVRLQGGITDSFIHLVEGSPRFDIGGEYLFFLTIPTGMYFDTMGYYYYLIAGEQSVFQHVSFASHEAGQFSYDTEGVFVQYGRATPDNMVGFSEIRGDIERINDMTPVLTAQDIRQMSADALRGNVERGVLVMSDDELQEWIDEILNPPSYLAARIILVE